MTRPRPILALLSSLALATTLACSDDPAAAPDLASTADLAPAAPSTIELPGAFFFPESLSAAADGTLYVGSVATGAVVRIAPGASTPVPFIPAGDPTNTAGVHADSATGTLYVCAVNFMGQPTELRTYDLATAALQQRYPVPGFCTDIAVDTAGRVFVTDSGAGVIHRLTAGVGLSVWKSDPLLASAVPGGFGANGIAVDGQSTVYVTNQQRGLLLRIAIEADGSAGSVTEIAVQPPLVAPDGLRRRADGKLIVAEALGGTGGRLTRVDLVGITGSAVTLVSGLRFPASVALSGGAYFVAEGQLDELLKTLASPPGTPMPTLPFYVRRVPME